MLRDRIGLKPTYAAIKNAYPTRVSNKASAKVLRGHRLTREHRITLPHTIQFVDPEIDESGVLILDLPTAKQSARGRKASQ